MDNRGVIVSLACSDDFISRLQQR